MSQFKSSYRGIGRLLTSDFIRAEMVRRAEKVEVRARATAPDYEPLGIGYIDEFEVTAGTKVSRSGTRRAVATVRNGSDHALYVEFGGRNTPAHRTLGRALSEAGG